MIMYRYRMWTHFKPKSIRDTKYGASIFLKFSALFREDLVVVGLPSFRPRFAGKCGRQSRDLTQSHQSYLSCSIHTWDDVAQKYSK